MIILHIFVKNEFIVLFHVRIPKAIKKNDIITYNLNLGLENLNYII